MADNPITLTSTANGILSEQERAGFGFTNRYRIKFSDWSGVTTTGATDTATFTLGALPAKWLVDRALVNVTTAYAGITAMTVAVGTTTATTAFVTAVSCLTVGAIQMNSALPVLTSAMATATKNIVTTFTAAGTGGPAGITAGQCDVYLAVKDLTQFP
jgi:hypothetical protein